MDQDATEMDFKFKILEIRLFIFFKKKSSFEANFLKKLFFEIL